MGDFLLTVGFLVGIWVYRDARKRGYGRGVASLWFLGVFLLVIVFLPVWLLIRGKTGRTPKAQRGFGRCVSCGSFYSERDSFCPGCGHGLKEADKPSQSDDSEPSLADFRIEVPRHPGYYGEPESKNKEPGRWIQPGQAVKIGNYEIRGGFFYSGGRLKGLDNYTEDSSLVDPALRINSRSPNYSGDGMGYWPSYGSISAESRAAYIEWLASGRDDPNCYIGYVFLYFYGIERRLIVDGEGLPDSEIASLVEELWRLKSIYDTNGSFSGYVTDLLSHAWVLYGSENPPDMSLLTAKGKGFTSVFKFLLGQTVADGKPVPGDLALAWVKSHPEFRLRTPARRCESEFDNLFGLRYMKKFGTGLVVNPNKTRMRMEYYPASASLSGYQGVETDLPDPTYLKAPVKKLMSLAESCTDDLDPYSRFVGRPGNSRESLSAAILLPDDLTAFVRNDKLSRIKSWINSKVENSVAVVPVQDFLSQFSEDAPSKINKKEAEMLADVAEKSGCGLAPDVRFHHARPEIEGNVVLFQNGHGSNFSPSHTFNRVGTVLRLGAMVASVDGHVDDSEVSFLEMLISGEPQLSRTEKRSLHAYLHWRLLNEQATMRGLKRRLESIGDQGKSAISRILVRVALADGKIDPAEVRQLEKLYSSLGLDKAMVSGDIHDLMSSEARTLPSEEEKVAAAAGTDDDMPPSTFSLDHDLLKTYKEETENVKAVLESIFVDEDFLDEPEESSDGSVETKATSALDEKHARLYDKLISKEQWSSEEAEAVCEELGLMVDGAIEEINDWAFENVEAPLIEIGSTIYVDLEIAEELKALAGEESAYVH